MRRWAMVYEYFANPENYGRTSDAVTNVKVFGDGRFAKDIAIAGVPIHFAERFVQMEKDKLLETRSEPALALRFCKQLRFESLGEHRTRLHMHFSYVSPGGVIGHNVAKLMGADAKTVLNDLLMRAKYFLETGRIPHDAAAKQRRAALGHNGSHKAQRFEREVWQGPGAPANDVLIAAAIEEAPSPWPPARSPMPETAEAVGRFPPPLD